MKFNIRLSQKYDRSAVLRYAKKLFDDTKCGFRFFEGGNTTILSTSFGVQLNFLLDNLADYKTDRISAALKDQQDSKTGLFIDHAFDMKDTAVFEEEYILWQFTYFTTIALDMLGDGPAYSFVFLNELRNRGSLKQWFERQTFRNFWYTSNKLMFLFYFFTYEQERLGIDNTGFLNCLFDMLDSRQDAGTGFWGAQEGASLANGMFGASHIYLYYNFYGRKINYGDRIIRSVTKLQNSRGLFGSDIGGACEEYDAVEILSVLMKYAGGVDKRVRNVLNKTYDIIRKNQREDGGFSYNIPPDNVIRLLADRVRRKKYYYGYSGWGRMESNRFKSDIWATYFRVMALAKIERMLGTDEDGRYKFYSLPGWGH